MGNGFFPFYLTVREDNRNIPSFPRVCAEEGMHPPAINPALNSSCSQACAGGENSKDTMEFVLVVLGGHAVQVLPVTVQPPGVVALPFCLLPICIFQKGICVVLKVCPQKHLPRAARQSTQRETLGF